MRFLAAILLFEAPHSSAEVRSAKPLAVEVDDLAVGDAMSDGVSFERDRLPEHILALEGRRVVLRGYLYPTYDERPKWFVLIGETKGDARHDNFRPHPPQNLISVRLADDLDLAAEEYLGHGRPMEVEGTLAIMPVGHDGALVALYRLSDARVRPADPRPGYHPSIGFGC